MKIVILAVGRTSTDYIRQATEAYLKRINHYIPVQMHMLPDVKARDTRQQKIKEGEAILDFLVPGDRVVLLDERGKELTSREFASSIEQGMISGLKRLVYVIGGPYGFAEDVYARADGKLSLSRMTFSHEMVRLFFAEQIYRAMTILRGEPYHHD